MPPADPSDFRPCASRQMLELRGQLLRRLRAFFDERGFLEVETPLLSADAVVDRHLDPLPLTLPDHPRRPKAGRRMFLQTSPEFHMKRLLATGEYAAIYQITRAFRAGERGAVHNPEFTIVEWYRVGDDMAAGMQLLSDLCQALLHRQPAELVSYAQAFGRCGPLQGGRPVNPHTADEALLASLLPAAGEAPRGLDRDGLLNFILARRIEPQLGRGRPAILYDYPASQAALARLHLDADGNEVASRFELYVDGVELANGYHELLDAGVLRERNRRNNRDRVRDGKPPLPESSRLLAAMEHGLPECTGAALGFDRLAMVAAGVKSIDEVLAFPIERA